MGRVKVEGGKVDKMYHDTMLETLKQLQVKTKTRKKWDSTNLFGAFS